MHQGCRENQTEYPEKDKSDTKQTSNKMHLICLFFDMQTNCSVQVFMAHLTVTFLEDASCGNSVHHFPSRQAILKKVLSHCGMTIFTPPLQRFIAIRSLTFLHTPGMSILKPSGSGCWDGDHRHRISFSSEDLTPSCSRDNPESAGQDSGYLLQFLSTTLQKPMFCTPNL